MIIVAETRVLRWLSAKTRKDRIRNDGIRDKLKVASIADKNKRKLPKMVCHVYRRPEHVVVRRSNGVQTTTKKREVKENLVRDN